MDKTQDFSKKIAIVLRKDLENWQALNTTAHISAFLGNKIKDDFDSGEYFTTKDSKNHPRNSQYPIIVLAANPGQLMGLMENVRQSGLLYHGFIQEMIETTNDNEIVEILKDKNDSEIEYLGIGIFGDNNKVKELTKKFSLWK